MTELPDNFDPEQCARFLREVGGSSAAVLPIAEAALALASFERPRVGLGRYVQHLAALGRDVARHPGASGGLDARVRALNEIVLLKYGYTGDELTYDDLQNANLMRVIDRRKGLPVALGILYLHAARAQGWECVGLGFPGHFLVRLSDGPERLILDPFHGGRVLDRDGCRAVFAALQGADAPFALSYLAPTGPRAILLRVLNNLQHAYLSRRAPDAVWVARLRLRFADLPLAERRQTAVLLGSLGRFAEAAAALDEVAAALDGTNAETIAAEARALRAREN